VFGDTNKSVQIVANGKLQTLHTAQILDSSFNSRPKLQVFTLSSAGALAPVFMQLHQGAEWATGAMAKLFSPLNIGVFEISHRLVMAASSTLPLSDLADHKRPMSASDYGRRATAGGLIIGRCRRYRSKDPGRRFSAGSMRRSISRSGGG
jgi:hypothetical protein